MGLGCKIILLVLVLSCVTATYKRVCYYDSGAMVRHGRARCGLGCIESTLCTHLMFGFAVIRRGRMAFDHIGIGLDDPTWYVQLHTLKVSNPSLKILISLGGPDFSDDHGLASILANRSSFVKSSIAFLRNQHFDGLDLYFQSVGITTEGTHKRLLDLLCQDLHNEFDAESNRTALPHLILTVAVPARKTTIDAGYALRNICKTADFINLLTFNFVGKWLKRAEFDSPLLQPGGQNGLQKENNIEWIAMYAVAIGCPNSKLVIGMPLFGKAYTLTNVPTKTTLHKAGSRVKGPAPPGPMLRQTPLYAYYEIQQRFLQGRSKRGWDKAHKAPYLCQGNIWVTYDTPNSLKMKVNWLVSNGYGGWMALSLDLDNFHKRFPLLKALAEATPIAPTGNITVAMTTASLSIKTSVTTESSNHGAAKEHNTTATKTGGHNELTVVKAKDRYTRLCSVNASSQHRPGLGKFRLTEVDPTLCSHLIIDEARILEDGIAFNNTATYADLAILKQKNPELKTILSANYGDFHNISKVNVLNPVVVRKRFAENAAAFLRMLYFDGIHWQGAATESEHFIRLLKTFRNVFDGEAAKSHRPSLLMSAATFPNDNTPNHTIANIARYVDFVVLMTFNLRGNSSTRTSLIAPLKLDNVAHSTYKSFAWHVEQAVKQGCPPEKLLLGFTAEGYSFHLENATQTKPGAQASGPGQPGLYTHSPGVYAYYEVCQLFIYGGGTRKWITRQAAPYIYRHSIWVTYEDQYSLYEKVVWLKGLHLAGWLFSSLDLDDFSGHFCGAGRWPLLHSLNTALLGDNGPLGSNGNASTTMHSNSLQSKIPLHKVPTTTEMSPTNRSDFLLQNGQTFTEKLF